MFKIVDYSFPTFPTFGKWGKIWQNFMWKTCQKYGKTTFPIIFISPSFFLNKQRGFQRFMLLSPQFLSDSGGIQLRMRGNQCLWGLWEILNHKWGKIWLLRWFLNVDGAIEEVTKAVILVVFFAFVNVALAVHIWKLVIDELTDMFCFL